MGGVGESKRHYWLITVKPFLSKRYRLGSPCVFGGHLQGSRGGFLKKGVEAFATYVKSSQICLLEFL